MKICNCKLNVALLYLLFTLFNVNMATAQSLYVGQSTYISAPSTPGVIDGAAWYCSDKSDYVSVSGDHYGATVLVNTYFSGTATIECKYGYHYYIGSTKNYGTNTAYYTISCMASQVRLNKKEVTLKPGEEIELTYTNSSGYALPHLLWTTSDKKVANFDYSEKVYNEKTVTVTAIGVGQCTITCDGHTGNEAPTCVVTVKADPPTGISVTPDKLTLQEGGKSTLSYILTPSDAYSKIIWSSSNESVAKVSSSGQVTAVKQGTAQITAKTENGLSASCTVTVTPLPTAVSLPRNEKITVGYGNTLIPQLTPSNSSTTYTWKSSDTSIASVDAAGIIRGIRKGSATITVTTANKLSATCEVEVVDAPEGLDYRNAQIRLKGIQELVKRSKK